MNNIYRHKLIEYIKDHSSACLCISALVAALFVVYRIMPPVKDLWAGYTYYNDAGGLFQFLQTERVIYQTCNGRIASNFINGILESFKSHVVLDLFNAIVNTAIYVSLWALCKAKRRFCTGAVLYIALMLLMSQQMRAEVLFYANSAYIVPVLLIPVYFILLARLEENVSRAAGITAWMCLVCFMICTWMEHIAVGFGVLLTLVCVHLFKVKDKFRYHVLCTWIVSAISGLIMMLSPGLRAQRTIIYIDNMLDMVKQNVRLYEEYIIGRNIPVVLCFLWILLIFIATNEKAGRGIKFFCGAVISIGIIWLSLAGMYCLWGNESFRYFYESLQFFSYPRSLIISTGVLVLFLGVICAIFIFSQNKMFLFGIAVICSFGLLPMLFTPNHSARVANMGFWGIVFFIIILFFEIPTSDLLWKRILCVVSAVTIISSFDQTILVTRRTYTVQKQWEEILREVRMQQMLGEWNYEDSVMLPSFHHGDLYEDGVASVGIVHYAIFLEFYGLKADTKVVFENY